LAWPGAADQVRQARAVAAAAAHHGSAARPQAVGALLRYFHDLDTAEEAYQDACLRALQNWPRNGPPRDPAAWLILVGRNAGVDGVRRRGRLHPLPPDEALSELDDVETPLAERLDGSQYRDDVLRLLFICCHPDLPATQQIPLALCIVSGLTVAQIARAFLVSEAAMEQRITRAKGRVARADVAFEAPGAVERAERLGAVAAMIYLVFNEGYSAVDGSPRAPLCEPRCEGDIGDLQPGWSGADRAERRPALQLHAGDLAVRALRDAAGGGRVVGEAVRGRRAGPLRLAEGSLRPVTADRSHRAGRDAVGPRPG
jgi:RNA polymerase sigma factor (sigma-70 family)